MAQVFKNSLDQANALVPQKNKSYNTFSYNGKNAWSGAVSPLDGFIEETHPYSKASANDFHHSFYFSEPLVKKIDNGDSLFFFVDKDGNVEIDPIGRGSNYNKDFIKRQILNQIKVGLSEEFDPQYMDKNNPNDRISLIKHLLANEYNYKPEEVKDNKINDLLEGLDEDTKSWDVPMTREEILQAINSFRGIK